MNDENALREKMELIERETGIKQIGLNQKKHAIYSKTTQVVNENTGEIAETIGTRVYKLKSRVEFLQLYVDNLNLLFRLEDKETKTLLFIFKNLSFMNTVAINSTLRRNISIGLDISLPTVSRALNGLIQKGILKKIESQQLREEYQAFTDDMYFVDPNIVGKGSFRELEKLRYTMTNEYDLSKMEFKKTVDIEHSYADLDNVIENIDKHRIIDIQSNQIDNKEKETNILIAEKENANSDTIIDTEAVESQKAVKTQNESLFSADSLNNNTKESKEIDNLLSLENAKIKTLELEIKKTNLYIMQQLIDAGKIDEALEFQNKQKNKEKDTK